MYFHHDGRLSTAQEKHITITLRPDTSTANGRHAPCLPRRDVINEILGTVGRFAEDCLTSDYASDRVFVARLIVEYPPNGAIEKVVRIPLSRDDARNSAEKDATHQEALRDHLIRQVVFAYEDYRLNPFLDDAMKIARCLNALEHWEGADVARNRSFAQNAQVSR
jgi:hypothetical protein